jgi:hypothetical protein
MTMHAYIASRSLMKDYLLIIFTRPFCFNNTQDPGGHPGGGKVFSAFTVNYFNIPTMEKSQPVN